MLVGIGIDILSLARLQAVIQRRGALRFAGKICTARELESFRALKHDEPTTLDEHRLTFLSTRWAAKEAAYKALPPDAVNSWRDLDLSHDRKGRPTLALIPGKRQGIHLIPTISHDAGIVVACVVAMKQAAS